MSEYQYYEFRTVDRPLTDAEKSQLRSISSRGVITSNSFTNVYHYGNFKGQPLELMKSMFDAHVYVTNWGYQELMLKVPAQSLDRDRAAQYLSEQGLSVDEGDRKAIVTFTYNSEGDGGGWVADEEAEEWMPRLLPLRDELAAGDLRSLYIGWLSGWNEEDEIEPPVPAGLGKLSPALEALAEFLEIDIDMLAEAATISPELPGRPAPKLLEKWIVDLPPSEKDGLVVQLLTGEAAIHRAEVLRRYQRETAPAPEFVDGSRTVEQLREAAEIRAGIRTRDEQARAAAEAARRKAAEAAAREKYLESLPGKEGAMWAEIEQQIEIRLAANYARATELLVDLRELSLRRNTNEAFTARLNAIMGKIQERPGLLKRLAAAGFKL